jgi:positive regulator of sigma E activity
MTRADSVENSAPSNVEPPNTWDDRMISLAEKKVFQTKCLLFIFLLFYLIFFYFVTLEIKTINIFIIITIQLLSLFFFLKKRLLI